MSTSAPLARDFDPGAAESADSVPRRPRTHLEEIHAATALIADDLRSMPRRYLLSLFPIASWLPNYQLEWLWGDFVAGLTVGLVAIPQSISYASKLAGLPAQFGLYTSFIGALLYALFATSKDVTIGPTAVLSLAVGQALSTYANGATTAQQVTFALTLSFWTGVIQLVIGLFRFGIVIDFVPIPVIAGFTTGAGIQVIVSQLPTLLGVKGVVTTNSPIQVLIDFFKAISTATKWDSIFGITSLAFILLIKYSTDYAVKKHGITWLKYVGFLKNTIVLLVYTAVSFVAQSVSIADFSIVGTVPYGLSGIQHGDYSFSYSSAVFPAIPGIVVISVLEHIAVVKTYGRVNGYTTNPNQEIIAMGVANAIGSAVGAIPATGSFSRSAIKAASGVRSPVGSFVTGIVVVIGLFSLTDALYYVPQAVLASIVVNSVADLVGKGKVAQNVIKIDIFDFIGFIVAFVVTIGSGLENAIYASVAYSLVVLLLRIARPRVEILSRTTDGEWIDPESDEFIPEEPAPPTSSDFAEGIFVFKVDEALTYPNSNYIVEKVKDAVLSRFKYTNTETRKADKSWSDDTEQRYLARVRQGLPDLPPLKAVVLDFSNVTNIDYTGFQILLDLKDDMARYTGYPVPFHFANVRRRQVNTLLGVSQHVFGKRTEIYSDAGSKRAWLKLTATQEETAVQTDRDLAALEYFHKSVDSAVAAAVREANALMVAKPIVSA